MNEKHYSVMLNECIDAIKIREGGTYLDLTLGRGGHSEAILKNLNTGTLISFDKDEQAIKESEPRLKKVGNNFKLIHSDYSNLKIELEKLGVYSVDGIIADLGVSSPQLDEADRGFSYNKDARLDMRMDQSQSLDAYEIVNTWSQSELVDIFRHLADVKPALAVRAAKGIVAKRPIETTLELVDVIRQSLPAAVVRKKNPAKMFFQAIRMAVNTELDSLNKMLDEAIGLLNPGANLAVITFHSVEDRCVKRKFSPLIKDETGKLPIIVKKQWKVKTYNPSKEELEINKRSRSAKLRVLTKLEED